MRPGRIADAHRVFTGPAAGDGVSALATRREVIGGYVFATSAWEPEKDDAIRLLAGADVMLGISAPWHPVVRLTTGDVPLGGPPVLTVEHVTAQGTPEAVRVTMLIPGSAENPGPPKKVWCEMEVAGDFARAVAEGIRHLFRTFPDDVTRRGDSG